MKKYMILALVALFSCLEAKVYVRNATSDTLGVIYTSPGPCSGTGSGKINVCGKKTLFGNSTVDFKHRSATMGTSKIYIFDESFDSELLSVSSPEDHNTYVVKKDGGNLSISKE